MEFRNCPSCKASVLEDDVEDCPFCGASMSGKPSAKPAPKQAPKPGPPGVAKPAAPPAKGTAATKPPAGAASSRTRPEPEPERPEDNSDPFEVDPLAHKQATSVSIKSGKGRTIEVKCPMCETVGFIAPSQAGKDVKCCNPGCKLPIFKSPKLPPEVKAEPEKAKGLSMGMISLLAVVGLSLVGGGIYYFILSPTPPPPKPVVEVPVTPVNTVPEPGPLDNVVMPVQKHEVSTVAEIRQLALQEILKVTIKPDIRTKPYGRQLAAEALLVTGDLVGAKEQIAKMGTTGAQYAVEPLALLALAQIGAGDKAAAEATLKEAVEKSAKLPNVLRSHLDAVVVLAATLVRFDRSPEAVELLGRFSQTDNHLRAALSETWRASLDQGTFDFAKESSLSHLELCGHPLWVATTVHLCRQGEWDPALAWSRATPDQVTQDAALAAWAGMIAAHQVSKPDPALDAKLNATIAASGLAAKVRMQVATAEVRLLHGDQGVTAATATELEALLVSTRIPPAADAPDMKAIYDSAGTPFAGLPDPRPGTSLALAMSDIADLQMKLGNKTGGWATLVKAMELLRSVSPSPAMAQHLFDQSNDNIEVIKNQLNIVLKLGDDEAQKRRALSRYRGQCEVILQLANDRFSIQHALLRRAMRFGLLNEVWQFAQTHEQAEMARLEPYRTGSAISVDLYYTALAQGNKEFAKLLGSEITPEEEKAIRGAESTIGTMSFAVSMAQAGDFRKAAESLKPIYVGTLCDRHLVDRHVLNQVSSLAEKSMAGCYSYTQRLHDPTIREDAMRMLAGLSIRLNQGPELWKLIDADRDLSSTDKASAYLGFLEGIQATGAQ